MANYEKCLLDYNFISLKVALNFADGFFIGGTFPGMCVKTVFF